MQGRNGIPLTVLVVAWMAAPAHAQWVITPYLGMNVSGDVEHGKGGPGGSLGYLGRRIGFEVDFQRYQHFFKDSEISPLDPSAPPNCIPPTTAPCADINTDAMGLMGNVVVPIHIPGAARWRPYGTAGLGVIRAWTNEEGRDQNDFGFNGGGGLMLRLNGRLGLRGDVRYFRALVDEDKPGGVVSKDYGFWRVTFGVTLGSRGNGSTSAGGP